MYPKFRPVDEESPGSNEPILKRVLHIVGLFTGIFCVIVLAIFGVASMVERHSPCPQDQQSQATEVNLSGRVVKLIDQNGTFMGYKMTYAGHDYFKVSMNGTCIHLESCPCKNVEEEEKP